MKTAVIISAQFLVELPENVDYTEAEAYGIDWLGNVVDTLRCLEYRHPKVAGIYLRPVPVRIKDMDADDIMDDSNLIQL